MSLKLKFGVKRLTMCALAAIGVCAGMLPAARAASLVQEFYLPMPEQQIYSANNSIIAGTGSTIASTFSIVVTGNGTVIYYDQWEDGYETDLSNPAQTTTQIWGDGNDAHGIPPGFAHNPLGLAAGTVITLTNNVTLPRNPSTFLWDARDRIGANKALIISRAGWPVNPGPVFAGAVSVLSTLDYGTNYISPVGQNLTNNLFKYVGMFVMAAQNNTAVTIDPNGTGVGTTNFVLNQGESYLVNGGIKTGGRVTATKPVQADLIIGHVGASYAADWFTLYPVAEWSSSYYTPVGSAVKITQPAYVYLYNPATNAITINYNTKVGSGSFSVPGTNGVFQFQMPAGSGGSFSSAGGQSFYALCTVAANSSSDTAYNWGFTLVPQGALTTEADAGWAPGSADGTVNGSPVWVTAIANTKLYVDYKGDHLGPLTDPNGNNYDTNFTVTALQSQKIFDPSKNQTGMRVYTLDGTLITAAWGEDPDTAQPGDPYIDAGTTVIPFPTPVLKKSAVIVTDTPPAGLSVGDIVQYTVEVDNRGLLPLGNTVVIDAPSGNLTYVTNSTTFNSNAVPDHATGAPFPLSSPGYTIPVILSQGTSVFQYLAQVNAGGAVSNTVDIGGTTISASAVLTPPPTNGASVTLNFTDTNGVPLIAYSAGANVFVTMTNAAGNTSSNSVQTINVTVVDVTHGDVETIALVETGNNTGVFRNVAGLPTSGTSGLGPQDGILNVTPGDTLSTSYTDPNFGDSATATALVQIPTPNKQLYLSVNGSTNGTQALNRIDPVAFGHGPTRTSVDLGSGSSGGGGVPGVARSASAVGNNTAGLTVSYTNVSGANQLMLVSVGTDQSVTVNSVTYNGVALNPVASIADAGSTKPGVAVFSLINPATGSNNLVVALSAAANVFVGVSTFTNVNQTSPLGTAVTATTTSSATVSSATNQLVYGTICGAQAETDSAGQNQQWSGAQGTIFGVGSTAAGAASVTMSWTPGGSSTKSAVVVVPLLPPVAGGGGSTNVTSFTQTPGFCSAFTLASNNLVTITNFITITNGSLPANPAITATLQYNGTNIITLSNPVYAATNSSLVWSGILGSNVTVPAGQVITYVISNAQANVAFHLNYDSTNSPSKITLPTSTVIQINTFGIYDAPYPGGNLVTTPVAGSTLYIRANVSDPFGSYDITSLGLAVTGPSPGSSFSTNLNDTSLATSDSCSKTYEFKWVTGPATGGYSIAATANEGTEGVSAVAATGISTTFLDLGTPSTTEFTSGANGPATNSYNATSPVSVRVTDLNRNTNSATVDAVIATVSSSTGDSETITLIETGTNTGIFTNSLAVSTNVVGAINDGTLYAPVGAILTASYTDPTDLSDQSSATATVQPAPGVPGVLMNKTILSPSGGQVGVGQAVTFNLQVVNVGSTTLPNLGINDSFPASRLGYSSASLAPSTIASGLLTWTNLGALTPGQSTNITVTFNTLAGLGALTNFATANGVSATNTSSATLLVNSAALNITKVLLSPTNTPVAVGSNAVFRITVQNTGNTLINNLPLEDTFSGAYYQFVSATIAPNGSGAGSLIWTNLASPTPLATNATITNDITMKVVGQGSPANNTATADFATDVFGNPVPTASGSIGVNTASAAINGHVYNDINQSGVFTNGDTGLSGVALQLFTDPNGDGNPSDGTLVQETTTDGNGYYEMLNLYTGHYVVVETDLPGYTSSAPVNNRLSVNVTNLTAFTNVNFFEYIPAPSLYSTITGTVVNDLNGNGAGDPGETGLANVEIDLVQDLNTNGLADPGEPLAVTTSTDTNGNYTLTGVSPGRYVIREVVPFGYYSTGGQIGFVSTNGIVSTNNNFFDRLLPVAVDDTNSAVYAAPVIVNPLTNDVSPNGDALTITNATTTNGIVVINAGGTNLTFTPTNAGVGVVTYTLVDAHGGASSANIMVGVSPALLVVMANNASRPYGQANPAFTGTLSGVVNGDNITATYASPATPASPVGTYAIVPTLVDPNGRLTNYTVASTNGTLTVGLATPVITWPTPTNIVYGTPLGTNQNDATTTVPGTFSYNPTNGTILTAGTNTLSVVFTPADTNYTANTASVLLVVTTAPLAVTANNASRPFGQTNPVFTGTLAGVVNGDNITATYASSANSGSPVGTYPIVPTLVDPNSRLANYTVSSTNGTLSVGLTTPVITWPTPTNIVYGTPLGTNQNDATTTVPGTFAYNPTNGTVLTVGTNTLSVVFTPGDTNYTTNTASVLLVVTPAPLAVTANNATRPFGQTNPIFTGTLTGVVNGDNITATYASSADSSSPVGTYPIVPTLVDPNSRLANYTVSSTNGTLSVGLTVSVITWPTPTNIVYGTPLGTNQNEATTTVPGTFTYNPTNGTVLSVGTNTLSVLFTPADTNYTTNTASVSLVVTPAPLAVTANNASRPFGQTNPIFTGTLTGVVNGDNITATYASGANSGSPVGTYPIVPTLVDPNSRLANYTVSSTNGTLSVGLTVSVITWPTPTNIVYGTPLGTNQNDATTTVPGTFTYNPTNGTVLTAGTNTLSVLFTPADTNYTTNTASVLLVVTTAPLAVTANNASRPFGQTNPVFTGTLAGVVNGDNITATYASSADSSSPVGTYPIVPALVDPSSRLANYTVSSTNGTLSVGLTTPVITWATPTNIVYGTPLGTNQNDATTTVPGTFTYNPTNGTVLTAGTNSLAVVFTPADTNYTTNTASVLLVVTTAPLAVTANNASRPFGQTNPIFTGVLTGVVNGDNITATYASSADSSSPVGTYPIVPTLVDPNSRVANYTVSSTNGTLSVGLTTPVITWPTPTNIVYGTPLGTNQNDATTTVPGTFTYNPTNGTVLTVGTNTLSVVFTPADTNYTTNTASVLLVVTPAPLAVTANNASRPYAQTNPVFTGTLTGVVNGDNITATYASSANSGSPVGTYPIVPTLVDPNSRLANYTVSSTNGTLSVGLTVSVITWPTPTNIVYGTPLGTNQNEATTTVPGTFTYNPTNGTVLTVGTNTLSVVFTPADTNYTTNTASVLLVITPAPLAVTGNNASRPYGQTNPAFTGTLAGVVNGDNITATYASSADSSSPVGSYPIVPTLVDPNSRLVNYSVNSTNGTLSVGLTALVITWPTPTNIFYGTPLGTNQNDATTTVPGTFTYNPTNGTVLTVGTNTLSVVFTPADTNYTTNTASVLLVVTPAPLAVTANSASRPYGQTNPIFSGTLTGVVNGDNITATYASSANAGSPVGTYPIVPTLVDPNSRLANYTVSSTNGTLSVGLTASVITWPTPTNIVYGTPLGTNQNDATTTVPGTFTYNPTNGTVLTAGTNTLSVVFTPADTNYTTNTASVLLVVTPAPLAVTANNASRPYGQTNPVFTGTLTGVVNGDNITATYASSANSGSPVGTYPIVPTLVDPNSRLANYTVSSTNGTLTVIATADIMVLLTGPTNGSTGSNLVYTITVTNLGPATSTNVVLTDLMPPGFTFISAVPATATVSGNTVTWPLFNLPSNGSTNFTLTLLPPPAGGSFTNIAFSTASTFDPNLANNNGSSPLSQVQTTVTPVQFALRAGSAVLNPQTGLYEESVNVTNIGATTVAGVRLFVGGLRSGVTLYNATGTTNGTPYVDYASALNPSNAVTFLLEFYDPARQVITNTLTAVEIQATNLPAAGTNGVHVTTMFMDTRVPGDTRFVLEFPTVPGRTYLVIYSDNLVNWSVATPSITANANVTQWYDDGPPKTASKPASVGSRYYIVIRQ